MALNILSHFNKSADKGITIWKLKDSERDIFLKKLPKPFRLLYLSDNDLQKRISVFGTTSDIEIIEKIPSKPNIQSAEFAEILLYYILPEEYSKGNIFNPEKWKWKVHKDRALQFTDVTILHKKDINKASIDDYIIAVESKAGASKPSNAESRLNDAKVGAEEDYLQRLAESLIYLKARYKDELNINAVNWLERFLEVPKYPPYEKHFKAVGVVDSAYSDTHINNADSTSTTITNNFEMILICITDLKSAYELVYNEMPNT